MPTEHAQIHAEKCEKCVRNPFILGLIIPP